MRCGRCISAGLSIGFVKLRGIARYICYFSIVTTAKDAMHTHASAYVVLGAGTQKKEEKPTAVCTVCKVRGTAALHDVSSRGPLAGDIDDDHEEHRSEAAR